MKSFKRTLKLYTQGSFSPEFDKTQPLYLMAYSYCLDKLPKGKLWGVEGISLSVEQLLTVIAKRGTRYEDFTRLNGNFYFNRSKEKVVWL